MHAFDPVSPPDLRGSLLVAHPVLRDPNFSRTIVLISPPPPATPPGPRPPPALSAAPAGGLGGRAGGERGEGRAGVCLRGCGGAGGACTLLARGGGVCRAAPPAAGSGWGGRARRHRGRGAAHGARALPCCSGVGRRQEGGGEPRGGAWVVAPPPGGYGRANPASLWRKVLRAEKPRTHLPCGRPGGSHSQLRTAGAGRASGPVGRWAYFSSSARSLERIAPDFTESGGDTNALSGGRRASLQGQPPPRPSNG